MPLCPACQTPNPFWSSRCKQCGCYYAGSLPRNPQLRMDNFQLQEPTQAAWLLLPAKGQVHELRWFGLRARLGKHRPEQAVEIDLSPFDISGSVSRLHAELYWQNGAWYIQDLGSTNGVLLKRLPGDYQKLEQPAPLQNGDALALGQVVLVFRCA